MSTNLYSKSDGTKELLDIPEKNKTTVGSSETMSSMPIIVGYSKIEGNLSPALFIIISGGVKREKDYFQIISKNVTGFPRIKIEFIAKNQSGEEGLSPRKMFEVALKIKEDYDKSKDDDIEDNTFLIVDVDLFMSEILEIKPQCEQLNMQLIISNSCFEIWLYYGEFDLKPADFKIPRKYAKISSEFKRYLGDKVPGGINPIKALLKIENAISNAKLNYELDENDIPKLFSTNMFILAEQIFELIKDDLDNWGKSEQKRKEEFIKGK